MICPECHADYLNHIKKCGDCNVSLIDACVLDLPIPEMTWSALPPFSGKIYADMAGEILDNNDIAYYLIFHLPCLHISSLKKAGAQTKSSPEWANPKHMHQLEKHYNHHIF
jgi:hypothetical protein